MPLAPQSAGAGTGRRIRELPDELVSQIAAGNTPYKMEDLEPIGLFTTLPFLTLAKADAKYANIKELAAYAKTADKPVVQKLMPVAVGLDAAGNATPALLKKLAALGADASCVPNLRRENDGKADVLFYESQAKGATLAEGLDVNFAKAVTLLMAAKGRVIVSGMGKSGHIARKIAATFASTGTPAHFVHPAEASHGDLGMVAEGDVLRLGDAEFVVWHLPGHAPGHVAFVGAGLCMSGDVLFAGSIGRTDLPGCDPRAMQHSLERLLTLPDDIRVLPGHGEPTSIARERAGNPFLRGLARPIGA
mgnify:CR=1 FL=1